MVCFFLFHPKISWYKQEHFYSNKTGGFNHKQQQNSKTWDHGISVPLSTSSHSLYPHMIWSVFSFKVLHNEQSSKYITYFTKNNAEQVNRPASIQTSIVTLKCKLTKW